MFKSLEKSVLNAKSNKEAIMLKHLDKIQKELRELDSMIHVKMNELIIKEKKMETLY